MGEKIIVVGSSTGGTEALKAFEAFVSAMPDNAPAILVTQHMYLSTKDTKNTNRDG